FQREYAHRPVLPPKGEHGQSGGVAGPNQKLREAAYPRAARLLPPPAGADGIAEIAYAVGKVFQESTVVGPAHGAQRGTREIKPRGHRHGQAQQTGGNQIPTGSEKGRQKQAPGRPDQNDEGTDGYDGPATANPVPVTTAHPGRSGMLPGTGLPLYCLQIRFSRPVLPWLRARC